MLWTLSLGAHCPQGDQFLRGGPQLGRRPTPHQEVNASSLARLRCRLLSHLQTGLPLQAVVSVAAYPLEQPLILMLAPRQRLHLHAWAAINTTFNSVLRARCFFHG